MFKQILPILILTIGITVSVLLIQQSTTLKSKAYELFEFVPSFHSNEGESAFNTNLDVYKDGIINAFDVIRDRYLQATKSASPSAEASKSAEASSSSVPAISPSPTPSPSPSPVVNPANEYQKILNNGNNPASSLR
jgi:hypothetical protein